ncbi:MAG: AEC family transporter [Bdellovibrionales bacterium]|nr:AEC family transporter [Bdellovibrionales bacterium]
MTNFVVIFICLIAGILCKRVKQFNHHTPQVLNAFIIYLSLPALVLSQLPKLLIEMDFESNWWLPVSMSWMSFFFSFVIFSLIGKKLNWKKTKIGALILTVGLGNTSFVGFPLLEALIGKEALPIGILVDQPGSFLCLSTVGILVAAIYSGAKVTPSFIAKRVLTFPPFIALLSSVLWVIFWGNSHPESLNTITPIFEKIGATLVPLALFSVGQQLQFDLNVFKKRWIPLSLGLGFKLIAFPLFFSFFYMTVLGGRDLATHVVVLESAMATMITAAVVANEFNLDSELSNLMVGVSIPISLITVPLWNHFLGF